MASKVYCCSLCDFELWHPAMSAQSWYALADDRCLKPRFGQFFFQQDIDEHTIHTLDN